MLYLCLLFTSPPTFAVSKVKYFQNKSCQIFNDEKEKAERLPLRLDSGKENHIKKHFQHTNARLEVHGALASLHQAEKKILRKDYGVSSLTWESVKSKLIEKWNSFEDIQLESSANKQDTFKIRIMEDGKLRSLVMKAGVVTEKGKDACVPQTIYEMKKSGLQFRIPDSSKLASWITSITLDNEFINIPKTLGYIENNQEAKEGKLFLHELKELLKRKSPENSDLDTSNLEPVRKRRRTTSMTSGQ